MLEDQYEYAEHQDEDLGVARDIVIAMLITVGFGLLAVVVLAVVV